MITVPLWIVNTVKSSKVVFHKNVPSRKVNIQCRRLHCDYLPAVPLVYVAFFIHRSNLDENKNKWLCIIVAHEKLQGSYRWATQIVE